MLYSYPLNHEILDERLANNLSGFSILQIEDLIADVKDDPDFNHEVYNSIVNAELSMLPHEMKDKCSECREYGLEDMNVKCCESDCDIFRRGVEFLERIDSSFDICYNCPESNNTCTGFEHCGHLNMGIEAKAIDVQFTPHYLFTQGVISEKVKDTIYAKGITNIDYETYESLEEFLSADVLRDISDYAFAVMERLGINVSTNNTTHKTTVECSDVVAQLTRNGGVIGSVKINGKTIKFFVKSKYISLSGKAEHDILTLIEKKVQEILDNRDYTLPKKIYST